MRGNEHGGRNDGMGCAFVILAVAVLLWVVQTTRAPECPTAAARSNAEVQP